MAPAVYTQTTSLVSCFNGKGTEYKETNKNPDEERSKMNPFWKQQNFFMFLF